MFWFRPQLSIPAPDGWSAKESTTIVNPSASGNVIASSEPIHEMDTQEYARAQGVVLGDELDGYRELSHSTMRMYDRSRAIVREFQWFPPDGSPVTQLQLYHVVGDRGYTATATTSSGNFANLEPTFRWILGGVSIVGPPPPSPRQPGY